MFDFVFSIFYEHEVIYIFNLLLHIFFYCKLMIFIRQICCLLCIILLRLYTRLPYKMRAWIATNYPERYPKNYFTEKIIPPKVTNCLKLQQDEIIFPVSFALQKAGDSHWNPCGVPDSAESVENVQPSLLICMLAKKTVDWMEFKNLMTLCWGCIPLVALCSVLCLIKEE